jgi:hypothetical protein
VETRDRDENCLFQWACSFGAFEIIQNNVELCIIAGKHYKMDIENMECSGKKR